MPMNYTRKLLKAGVLPAALVILSTSCFAQTKGPTWLRFQTTKIKPDMRQEFEGYLKQVPAAYKKAGAQFFIVLVNAAGDMNEYTSVTPIAKFAEMDGPSPLIKNFGEEGAANLVRGLARCQISQTRYYSLAQDDLAINKGAPTGTLWMFTRTFVNPGKMQDYANWMKNDYKPALEKAGVTQLRVSRPIFGAANNQIESIRMLKDFAEIDGGPILNKLGADTASAINAKAAGLVRTSMTTLVRIRPDLSYLPATTGSN